MSWIYLVIAGFFEILSIFVMKKTSMKKGISSIIWFLCMMSIFGISLGFLSLAMREIEISVAYAVWTGIGTIGGVFMASLFFKENITWLKGICLFIIIASVIGLKLLG
ncbi:MULTISPECIES: DMT family transporter [unclassified Helicobacter]|uniref:DMT family transporter n=1 Tax=unclassified Helicobacter TaxID=2593540 RepID=UPI000CF0667E|nr:MULTISPECIES: multidrug efflux SMR transporter [unclassified Helicobacter]